MALHVSLPLSHTHCLKKKKEHLEEVVAFRPICRVPQTRHVRVTVLPEGADWTTGGRKQRTVQAQARSTSHAKQKVIKHAKGSEPWSVWDQKPEEEAHHANAGLNSSRRTSATACL